MSIAVLRYHTALRTSSSISRADPNFAGLCIMMEPAFFTINACNRCRKRKARCDANIPACMPCQNSGSVCEFMDNQTRSIRTRSFILELEDEVAHLQKELETLSGPRYEESRSPDHERRKGWPSTGAADRTRPDVQTHPDLIRLEPGGDAHFLGVSSGMHLARTVLESAQQNAASFTSASNANRQQDESPSNLSNSCSGARHASNATLPSQEIAISLIEIFFDHYQVEDPILIETDFVAVVKDYYNRAINGGPPRDDDIWTRFMLNMVLSIALGSLSRDNLETRALSQGFSSNAMTDLSTIMQTKDLRTLQCLLLLLLSSVLNSSSTPIWYISGLCMRMCVDLGFHSEKTIQLAPRGLATADEADSKRRLLWVTYTFDRTLGTILGRPFTLDDDKIDVQFPDCSLPEPRKPQILHWLRLQRLQSEIVHRLYTGRDNDSQSTDQEPDVRLWTADMAEKLAAWKDENLAVSDSNGHSTDWWKYWHQYALLILYRPSPARPKLDSHALSSCYAAAKIMVQLSFIRAYKGVADFTWLDLHYHYMSGITLLFLVWKNPEARAAAQAEWTAFKSCLVQWEAVLERLATRWQRVSRARDVLVKLADTTVNLIEEKMTKSSAGGALQQHRNRREGKDRRQSIIEQLGSPSAHLPSDRNQSSHHISETTRSETIQQVRSPYSESGAFTVGQPSLQDVPQPRFETDAVQNRTQGPRLASSLSPSQMPPHGASPASWPHGQQAPQQALESDVDSFFMSQDLSALLNDEIWSGFGTYDSNDGVPGAMFDYFPMPMAVPTPVIGADLGMGVGSMIGRTDGVFTDSILNFRGTLNESSGTDDRAAQDS